MCIGRFHSFWQDSQRSAKQWLRHFRHHYNLERPNQGLDGRTPVEDIQNQTVPRTEYFRGLGDEGMVDIFRDQHGYGKLELLDVSHLTQTDEPLAVPPGEIQGKRFDHMIAYSELNPQDYYYDQDVFTCSDHPSLIAEFDI